ncbi:MAG: hypothetical protein D6730_14770 [Bacteroidetes bacterium]|nr:MAG: hypothetical protein D6730_14770 [Bacteroidota bacterium]
MKISSTFKLYPQLCLVYFTLIASNVHAQWSLQYNSFNNAVINEIEVVSPQAGYAAAEKTLLRFDNESWITINPLNDTSQVIANSLWTSVDVKSESELWAFGYNYSQAKAVIIHSTDRGLHWEFQFLNTSRRLYSGKFINENLGLAVGQWGECYITRDGGLSWDRITVNTSADLYNIYFLDEQRGFITGRNVLLYTADGGTNWTARQYAFYEDIQFLSDTLGYAISNGTIYTTRNLGLSWQQLSQSAPWARGLHVISRDSLLLVGSGGIYLSSDGGTYWELYPNSGASSFRKLYTYRNQLFWANTGYAIWHNPNPRAPVKPNVNFFIEYNRYCIEDTLQIVQNSNPAYEFKWYVNDTLVGTGYDPPSIVATDQLVRVTLEATYNGLTASYTSVTSVTPFPEVEPFDPTSPYDTICKGNDVQIQWYNGQSNDTYQLFVDGSPFSSPFRYPYYTVRGLNESTTFDILAKDSNHCGVDTLWKQIRIEVFELDSAGIGFGPVDTSVCRGEGMELRIRNPQPGLLYFLRGGNASEPDTTSNGELIFEIPDVTRDYVYELSGLKTFNGATCRKVLGQSRLKMLDIHTDFKLESAGIFAGQPKQLLNLSRGDHFQWNFGPEAVPSTDTAAMPLVTFTRPGKYAISLINRLDEGCADTMEVNLIAYNQAEAQQADVCKVDEWSAYPYYNSSILDTHVDEAGNIYATGYSAYSFDNRPIKNLFVVKLNAQGEIMWLKQVITEGIEAVHGNYGSLGSGIDTDSQGNVYVVGSYHGNKFNFDGLEVTAPTAARNAFLAKLSPQGEVLWIVNGTVSGSSSALSGFSDVLWIDDEHLYVTGELPNIIETPSGQRYGLSPSGLLCLNTEGEYVSFTRYTANNYGIYPREAGFFVYPVSPRLAKGPQNKVYLVALIEQQGAQFGNISIPPETQYRRPNLGIVAIYNPSVGWEAAFKTFTSVYIAPSSESLPAFTVDSAGNVYVAFRWSNSTWDVPYSLVLPDETILPRGVNSLLAKYDPSGNLLWHHQNANITVRGLAMGNNDLLYAYGAYSGFAGLNINHTGPDFLGFRGEFGSNLMLYSISMDGVINRVYKLGNMPTVSQGSNYHVSAHLKVDESGTLYFSYSGKQLQLGNIQQPGHNHFGIGRFAENGPCANILPKNISGTVRAADGSPLQGSKVYLMQYPPGRSEIKVLDSTLTAADGRYSLSTLAFETFLTLKALPPPAHTDWLPAYFSHKAVSENADLLDFSQNEPTDREIILFSRPDSSSDGHINGHIVTTSNAHDTIPVSGLPLLLISSEGIAATDTTDSMGYFAFEHLDTAHYQIWVDLPHLSNELGPHILLSPTHKQIDSLYFFLFSTYLKQLTPGYQEPDTHTALKWLFGQVAGIDFTHQPHELIWEDSPSQTNRKFSTICDEAGNVLFYSDGYTVWNALHQPMPNGQIYQGTQNVRASMIVPHPAGERLYFLLNVYSVNAAERPQGLYYALIDMNLDNGKGDVVQSNVLLMKNIDHIIVIQAANGKDYWILAIKKGLNQFFSIPITQAGIQQPSPFFTGPFISDVNAARNSPKGNYLAISDGPNTYLYHFDTSRGIAAYYMTIPKGGRVAFSADESRLYLFTNTGVFRVLQYDLGQEDPNEVLNSKEEKILSFRNLITDVQLTPEHDLLLNAGFELGYIKNANRHLRSTTIIENGLQLPTIVSISFPGLIQSFFASQNDVPQVQLRTDSLSIPEDSLIVLTLDDFAIHDSIQAHPDSFQLEIWEGEHYTRSGDTIFPNPNFYGLIQVPISVFDGESESLPLSVPLRVEPVNDVPVIHAYHPPAYPGRYMEDTPIRIFTHLLEVEDPDNQFPDDFSLRILPGEHYTSRNDTVFPEQDYADSLFISLVVSDGINESPPFFWNILLQPVNDPPRITGFRGQLMATAGEPFHIELDSLIVEDIDNEFPDDFLIIVFPGSNYRIHANQIIVPDSGFSGILYVPIRVRDTYALSNMYLLEILVGDPFSIQGSITDSRRNELDSAKVELLIVDDSSQVVVWDSTFTSQGGTYRFESYEFPPLFYLKASPPSAYPNEQSVFYDTALIIQDALGLSFDTEDTLFVDIATRARDTANGNGRIGGIVFEEDASRDEISEATGIQLLLLNSLKVPVEDDVTNEGGAFLFTGLPPGSYYLWVNQPGIRNELAPEIHLTENEMQRDSLHFVLHDDHLELVEQTTGIETYSLLGFTLRIYPSLVDEGFFIVYENSSEYFSGVLELDLFNQHGQKVSSRTLPLGPHSKQWIAFNGWASGLYYVSVSYQGQPIWRGKIMKK